MREENFLKVIEEIWVGGRDKGEWRRLREGRRDLFLGNVIDVVSEVIMIIYYVIVIGDCIL